MANDKLIKACEASGLSTSAIVARVNKILYDSPTAVAHSAFNRNYLGKLKSWKIKYPNLAYRNALRLVLGKESDEELGFIDLSSSAAPAGLRSHDEIPRDAITGTVDTMKRRTVVIGTGVALGAAALGHPGMDLLSSNQDENDGPVTPDEINEVATAAALFKSWDDASGGATGRRIADVALSSSARLLKRSCPSDLRDDMHAALARLAGVVAFMHFDAYAHAAARKRFAFALQCAELGHNWNQRAHLLCSMARQSIWCGQPDDGITYTEMGLVRADRLTATERAMLHTVRARGLAKFGASRAQEALAAVGNADEEFAHTNPAADPPWMGFYDDAQHHGDTGHALYDVAISSSLTTDAGSRLGYSIQNHQPEFARSRAISGTTLASLTMLQGDPVEASAIGHAALDDVDPVRSLRAADGLRILHRLSEPYALDPTVAALRSRIEVTVGVAA